MIHTDEIVFHVHFGHRTLYVFIKTSK